VQPDLLFVEDGGIFTSAGAAAAIDLCLHLVRTDYGAAVANTAARLAVVLPVRPGGQSQFIQTLLPPERGTSLAPTRASVLEHLDRPLTLTDLAGHARTSVRTLTRRFHAETGLSPLRWLLHQRIDRAKELLEITGLPMDPGSPGERPGQRGLPPQAHDRPGRPHSHGLSRELRPGARGHLPLRPEA
jgi:transcriptional regulator GlxA family with amidase domain